MGQKHIRLITRTPEVAQVSNFEIKLNSITEIIDRLLLVPRQAPWKAVGSTDGTTNDTDTTTGTDIDAGDVNTLI